MNIKKIVFCLLVINGFWDIGLRAQVDLKASVNFLAAERLLEVHQELEYTNSSSDTLQSLYLNDWNNAFATRDSPLARQFGLEYKRRFHFSQFAERGYTKVIALTGQADYPLDWQRPEGAPDNIKIRLDMPLLPGETMALKMNYVIRIPEDKFTGFGADEEGNYDLRHWLILPAVYQKGWQNYSHKGLNDDYYPFTDVELTLTVPESFQLSSEFRQKLVKRENYRKTIELTGRHKTDFEIALFHDDSFYEVDTPHLRLLSNLEDEGLPEEMKTEITQRISTYLKEYLGEYPDRKIFITNAAYKKNPIYGLNQLPSFIRPFSGPFQYELKLVKSLIHRYLTSSLQVQPREESWFLEGMEIYLLMKYIDQYYPDMKLIGKLSETFGIRWTHLADLPFNDKYSFLFMNMNRLNLDQPLTMPKDSLVRFNRLMANPYKAGVGFQYLDDFLGNRGIVDQTIHNFYEQYQGKPGEVSQFRQLLEKATEKDIDWFFEDYVKTNKRLDFTFKKVVHEEDSLHVVIRNKIGNTMPVSLYTLDKKGVVLSKTWVEKIVGEKEVTLPYRDDIKRVGLNVEGVVPEFNQRDNYKNIRGLFNTPLQFRIFKDVEDPHYSQVFFMPQFSYNLYDGFSLGSRVSNQAFLYKPFQYQITPQYAFSSHSLVGDFQTSYNWQFRNQNLSSVLFGVMGSRYSFDYHLYSYRFVPYVQFTWRHRDLMNKERQYLSFRNVNLKRDASPQQDFLEKPNYNVFDVRYTYSNKSLVNTFVSSVDYQVARKFSKVALTAKYRKLFMNNRQFEVRFFGGAFLKNKTHPDSDYFSFALDRPTDYLFDYNYYGRSENSGFFSQQFIESEGGFKSRLEPAFADQWIGTVNTSLSFWKDVAYVYGDFGVLKSRGEPVRARYDSGLRLSLVQDYFEVFFPVYSSQGWEVGQPHYDQKIRFIITLDFQTLLGLFERSFY